MLLQDTYNNFDGEHFFQILVVIHKNVTTKHGISSDTISRILSTLYIERRGVGKILPFYRIIEYLVLHKGNMYNEMLEEYHSSPYTTPCAGFHMLNVDIRLWQYLEFNMYNMSYVRSISIDLFMYLAYQVSRHSLN